MSATAALQQPTRLGRPRNWSDAAWVAINTAPRGAATRVNQRSIRRAVIDTLIDAGGAMSLGSLEAQLGYDPRAVVRALSVAGWLTVTES